MKNSNQWGIIFVYENDNLFTRLAIKIGDKIVKSGCDIITITHNPILSLHTGKLIVDLVEKIFHRTHLGHG